MEYVFNPLTGTFELVQRPDPFGVITTFDCGDFSDLNEDFLDEIDCGDAPSNCFNIYDLGDF